MVLVIPTITKCDGLVKSFLASKDFSGKRPLKWSALGSTDKYTTLLPLAWLIKPVFHQRIFFVRSDFLLNSHWLAFFWSKKKVGSNPIFHCFRTKKVASYEKIWDQVCQEEFCKFDPNIHRIPLLTLKLWNDAERTFKL